MASQIAHIIYAQRFFQKIESGKISQRLLSEGLSYPLGKIDKDEFILGATFPDIRRIDASIKRNYTHMHFPKIDLNFSQLTFFEAGWKFHLWCDMRRDEILSERNFFSMDNADDFGGYPSKILEDEIVYGEYNNWEKLCAYFNNPPYIKSLSSVSRETFNLWYAILAKYMEHRPDEKSMRIFFLKQPSLAARTDKLVDSIKKLRENKKAVEIISQIGQEML